MQYDDNWQSIEERHDRTFPFKVQTKNIPTLSCLSLQDCAIMTNWFGYAKGIGDKTR